MNSDPLPSFFFRGLPVVTGFRLTRRQQAHALRRLIGSFVGSMARSSSRKTRALFGGPIIAVVLFGLSCHRAAAFTVPSIPGLSAFAGSSPARQTVGSSKLVTLNDNRRAPFQAQNAASGVTMAAVRNPQLIGTMIPRSWTEGTDFIRDGRGIAKGDLVIIQRSDGRYKVLRGWIPLMQGEDPR
jgi:hypothetical protein